MRSITLSLIPLIFISCAVGRDAEPDAAEEIRAAMEIQVNSWNSGDMAGYMNYYLKSPELTFHSGSRLLLGWETLDSMYRAKYSGPARGVLLFDETAVSILSRDSAYVTGRWRVQLPDTIREGRFTLVFRKFDEGWKIVHDHSS